MRSSTFLHLLSILPLPLPLLLTTTLPTLAIARCCPSHDHHCNDGTNVGRTGTCCGYGKCQGSCCFCKGFSVIASPLRIPWGTSWYTSSTTITADPGVTWHCREASNFHDAPRPDHQVQNTLVSNEIVRGERVNTLEWKAQGIGDRGIVTFWTDDPSAVAQAMATVTATPAAPMSAASLPAQPLITSMSTSPNVLHGVWIESNEDEAYCNLIFDRLSNGTGRLELDAYLDFFGIDPALDGEYEGFVRSLESLGVNATAMALMNIDAENAAVGALLVRVGETEVLTLRDGILDVGGQNGYGDGNGGDGEGNGLSPKENVMKMFYLRDQGAKGWLSKADFDVLM